jgi:putative endonuclease
MFYVYILESQTTHRLYIGQSDDPDKRLNDHNRGASIYTKDKGPWMRIFLKAFSDRSSAMAYEKKLKSWKNADRIRSMITRETSG